MFIQRKMKISRDNHSFIVRGEYINRIYNAAETKNNDGTQNVGTKLIQLDTEFYDLKTVAFQNIENVQRSKTIKIQNIYIKQYKRYLIIKKRGKNGTKIIL